MIKNPPNGITYIFYKLCFLALNKMFITLHAKISFSGWKLKIEISPLRKYFQTSEHNNMYEKVLHKRRGWNDWFTKPILLKAFAYCCRLITVMLLVITTLQSICVKYTSTTFIYHYTSIEKYWYICLVFLKNHQPKRCQPCIFNQDLNLTVNTKDRNF